MDENNGWAVGYFGTVLRTNDGGNQWEDISTGLDVNLNCVSFVNLNEGWTAGEFGTLLHTTTGGEQWKDHKVGERSIFGIDFTDPQHGWAVGLLGILLSTSDGGATWVAQESGTDHTLFDIVVTGDAAFSVGEKGVVVKTSLGEGGEYLQSAALPRKATKWLSGLCFLADDNPHLCAVGSTGTVLYSQDGGDTWFHKGLTF